jgi:hypothetical protein
LFEHTSVAPIAESVTSVHNTGSGASVVVVADVDVVEDAGTVVVGAVVVVVDATVVEDEVSAVSPELVHAATANTTPTTSISRRDAISTSPAGLRESLVGEVQIR